MSKRMVLMLIGIMIGCPSFASAEAKEPTPHRIEVKHLHNVVQVHPKVLSGGLPEGNAAFEELQALGIKTIISVDGARPDTAMAAEHGLRYVHLPHGYDGVPDSRAQELAKAVLEFDGPIYIHCHHGKHRSPAAASVACVAAGLLPKSLGTSVLEVAGTSLNYRGLYQSVLKAKPIERDQLDHLNVEFRASVEVPPMAEAMVAMEQTHDHLKAIAVAGWQTPVDHPDLDPAHEALLMREHFTELMRTDETKQQPQAFQNLLIESLAAAQALEDSLQEWQQTSKPKEANEASAHFQKSLNRISTNCRACHQAFRDVPLGEKPSSNASVSAH